MATNLKYCQFKSNAQVEIDIEKVMKILADPVCTNEEVERAKPLNSTNVYNACAKSLVISSEKGSQAESKHGGQSASCYL